MKEIVEKHVLLSMNNGHVLEGFVSRMDDLFLTLVEHNNQKVIVRVEDISFARLGPAQEEQQSYRPAIESAQPYGQIYKPSIETSPQGSEEYSMTLPNPQDDDIQMRRPELVRRSQR